ncbi:MAG: hypothetical protein ABIH21_00395 [Patescibacteria group bacterium]
MIKKGILFGILWWILIFVEVSIIGFIPALAERTDTSFIFNSAGWIIHFIAVIVIGLVIAYFAFRSNKGGYINGIKLGVIMLIIATILDIIITVPLFVKDYGMFFADWKLWLGILLGILAIAVGAQLFGKKLPASATPAPAPIVPEPLPEKIEPEPESFTPEPEVAQELEPEPEPTSAEPEIKPEVQFEPEQEVPSGSESSPEPEEPAEKTY